MHANQLDHVALFVADRDALADLLLGQLEWHVIDKTERYTLLGPTATAGKLTLFDAPAGSIPQTGHLASLLLHEPTPRTRSLLHGEGGLRFELGAFDHVPADTPRHALVGLTLRSANPAASAQAYVDTFGFEPRPPGEDGAAAVGAGTGVLRLVREGWQQPEQPMLNHLGMLVDSAQSHLEEARQQGLASIDWVDAPNTLAVFVDGPEGTRVEYVEHKPSFALA
jgi:catechol 2,3-dioxygenase-like lactoylglutathione lyase family enzyme